MNIWITSGGFISTELNDYFSENEKYNVVATNRTIVDMRNSRQVCEFVENGNFDVVIHTAARGGSRLRVESFQDFCDNVNMFNNLYRQREKFGMMIMFGSGAEFDRRAGVFNAREEEIFTENPTDHYGHSKNLIARVARNAANVVNLRLFGCFSPKEINTRFIKSAIKNALTTPKDSVVERNGKMDFFYIGDLLKVVKYYVDNHQDISLPRNINMCYNKSFSLIEIENQIKSLTNVEEKHMIATSIVGWHYTGSGYKLSELDIKLDGFKNGLEECVKNYERK